MERRYFSFFMASLAIILIWRMMNPPPNPVRPPGGGQQVGEEEKPDDGDEAVALDADLPEVEVPEEDTSDVPPYVTLGSVEPGGPFREMALFDTKGATLRRLELSSLEYRDLHDTYGYVGRLEWIDDALGVKIQVVPPGTPAAEAGLAAGDIITGATYLGKKNPEPVAIANVKLWMEVLEKTKPGKELKLDYLRGGVEKSTQLTLMKKPLELIRPEAENIHFHTKELPKDFEQHYSLELKLDSIGPKEPAKKVLAAANKKLVEGTWIVTRPDDNSVVFRKRLPQLGLEVRKVFTLPTVPEDKRDAEEFAGYHLDFKVEFENLSPKAQTVTYRLQGPNGLPVEGWWYANKVGRGWSAYGLRDVVVQYHGQGAVDFGCRNISWDKVKPITDGSPLAFAAVDAQYFSAAVLPKKQAATDVWYASVAPTVASTKVDEKKSIRSRYENASFVLTSRNIDLEAAGTDEATAANEATLFLGPKLPSLLEEYPAHGGSGQSLRPLVYYGYAGSLGIPQAMVSILSGFYYVVGNYGVAIILLTCLVRGCMFPLSRKQAKTMAKMQELKPELDRIAAKYKDDLQARHKAQMELQAKHNCNPYGSCYLALIQLPIFIGLYRALMVDVELRGAPLLPGIQWCSNLAAPDRLFDWTNIWPDWQILAPFRWFFNWMGFANGEGMFALGPYFNLLPFVTVGLFLLQQKLFMPPAADEQARMMQNMMKYVMLFMGFMFYKVAAGLCLYFIASTLWAITEKKLVPQPTPSTTTPTIDSSDDETEGITRKRKPSTKAKPKRKPSKKKR